MHGWYPRQLVYTSWHPRPTISAFPRVRNTEMTGLSRFTLGVVVVRATLALALHRFIGSRPPSSCLRRLPVCRVHSVSLIYDQPQIWGSKYSPVDPMPPGRGRFPRGVCVSAVFSSQNRYCFWYYRKGAQVKDKDPSEAYESGIKVVESFQTVEHFWRIYNHILRADQVGHAEVEAPAWRRGSIGEPFSWASTNGGFTVSSGRWGQGRRCAAALLRINQIARSGALAAEK